MTTKKYDCARAMLENGGHPQEIADYLNVSRATINRIKRTETFEAYQKLQRGYKAERKPEKKPEKKEAKPEKSPEQTSLIVTENDLCGLIREQNEILTLMCEKLAWIVDALR